MCVNLLDFELLQNTNILIAILAQIGFEAAENEHSKLLVVHLLIPRFWDTNNIKQGGGCLLGPQITDRSGIKIVFQRKTFCKKEQKHKIKSALPHGSAESAGCNGCGCAGCPGCSGCGGCPREARARC